jgi:hypothetical protein
MEAVMFLWNVSELLSDCTMSNPRRYYLLTEGYSSWVTEQTLTFQGLSFMCVLHDHSNTPDPCCALCIMSTPNKALCIVITTLLRSRYVTPSDDDMYFKNSASQHLFTLFLRRHHTMDSLCANFTSLCIPKPEDCILNKHCHEISKTYTIINLSI